MCKSDPSSSAEHCPPQGSSAELAQGAMGRVPGQSSAIGGVMGSAQLATGSNRECSSSAKWCRWCDGHHNGQGNLAPAQVVQATAAPSPHHASCFHHKPTASYLPAPAHQQELEANRMISNRLICQIKPSEIRHFGLAIQHGPWSRAQLGSLKGSHTRLTATGSSQGTHSAASETHGHTNRLSKATLQV